MPYEKVYGVEDARDAGMTGDRWSREKSVLLLRSLFAVYCLLVERLGRKIPEIRKKVDVSPWI